MEETSPTPNVPSSPWTITSAASRRRALPAPCAIFPVDPGNLRGIYSIFLMVMRLSPSEHDISSAPPCPRTSVDKKFLYCRKHMAVQARVRAIYAGCCGACGDRPAAQGWRWIQSVRKFRKEARRGNKPRNRRALSVRKRAYRVRAYPAKYRCWRPYHTASQAEQYGKISKQRVMACRAVADSVGRLHDLRLVTKQHEHRDKDRSEQGPFCRAAGDQDVDQCKEQNHDQHKRRDGTPQALRFPRLR